MKLSHAAPVRYVLGALVVFAVPACAEQAEEGPVRGTGSDTGVATDLGPPRTAEAPACWTRAEPEELAGRPSPLDSTSVALEGGVVKVCYGSPRMRGREVFGGLVPRNEPWRTGANEATSIHMPARGTIAGVPVEAGRYSLYSVPATESWEIVVNGQAQRWGIPITAEVRAADVGSATVPVATTDGSVEGLTFTLSRTAARSADLAIEWETSRLDVPIRLE